MASTSTPASAPAKKSTPKSAVKAGKLAATSSSSKSTSAAQKLPSSSVGADVAMAADEDEDQDQAGAEPWMGKGSPSGSTSTAQAGQASSKQGDDDVDDIDDDDAVMIDPNSLATQQQQAGAASSSNPVATTSEQGLLAFPALSAKEAQGKIQTQTRKVSIPPHRMTPLKRDWPKIYSPLVDECGLMVRMNVGKKCIEMKTSKHTPAPSGTILQRAVDFVAAYGLGFSAEDAVALLRMDDLYVESFEIKDVKSLSGDHLSRAIGRIAGKDGKTKFVIENTSRTRVVIADTKISILGNFSSIKIARDAICNLILGSPPGKTFNSLKTIAARQKGRF